MFISKPESFFTTSREILPMPMMPTVAPFSSMVL